MSKTKYDSQLKEIQHYQIYPQMLPFIGDRFEQTRVLLICESHYLPGKEESEVILDRSTHYEAWYAGRETLNDMDKCCITTRGTLFNRTPTMNNLKKAIDAAGKSTDDVAFMNGFQRPAGHSASGRGFDPLPIDCEKAREVVGEVVRILQPKHIGFISTKTYKTVHSHGNLQKINVRKFVHPSSPWWWPSKLKFIKWLRDC